METVIIVVHLLLAVAMILLVLMQQSEGGLGGMGGSSSGGGMGGFMTSRATANLLTRTTGVLATFFFITSMALAIMADQGRDKGSILDKGIGSANQSQIPVMPLIPTVPNAPNR
jgi:preprotein translocase subunit SecG